MVLILLQLVVLVRGGQSWQLHCTSKKDWSEGLLVLQPSPGLVLGQCGEQCEDGSVLFSTGFKTESVTGGGKARRWMKLGVFLEEGVCCF